MDPSSAHGWCAWAWAEHRASRTGRAAEGFRWALAIDPSSVPAGFGLASMLLDGGDVDGAGRLVTRMSRAAAVAERPDVLWLTARLAAARGE
uniref:hypothetical protein n=1 Tax=Sphingomonas bacterium TaxID=1895847 RepID=UPI001C2D97AE